MCSELKLKMCKNIYIELILLNEKKAKKQNK